MGRVLVQQPGTNTTKALSETLPKNVIIVDEDLKELRLHDGVTPGGKIIGQSAGSGVPIGTIIPFAGNSVPQGYLLCDGSAISRTDYASLFAVIGTIYGAGDGNSTFNLPNLSSARLVSNRTVSVMGNGKSLGLVNGSSSFGLTFHTGSAWALRLAASGAGVAIGTSVTETNGTTKVAYGVHQTASLSGLTGTLNLAQSTRFCIKYHT